MRVRGHHMCTLHVAFTEARGGLRAMRHVWQVRRNVRRCAGVLRRCSRSLMHRGSSRAMLVVPGRRGQ